MLLPILNRARRKHITLCKLLLRQAKPLTQRAHISTRWDVARRTELLRLYCPPAQTGRYWLP